MTQLAFSQRETEILRLVIAANEHLLYEDTESDELTEREQDVLLLLASGRSPIQIAAQLTLSPFTVRNHISNIKKKFGAPNVGTVVAIALKLSIVTVDQIDPVV